eukprot:2767086-Prymnesium_polylepis.1
MAGAAGAAADCADGRRDARDRGCAARRQRERGASAGAAGAREGGRCADGGEASGVPLPLAGDRVPPPAG